jgi:hypothetical protein
MISGDLSLLSKFGNGHHRELRKAKQVAKFQNIQTEELDMDVYAYERSSDLGPNLFGLSKSASEASSQNEIDQLILMVKQRREESQLKGGSCKKALRHPLQKMSPDRGLNLVKLESQE